MRERERDRIERGEEEGGKVGEIKYRGGKERSEKRGRPLRCIIHRV